MCGRFFSEEVTWADYHAQLNLIPADDQQTVFQGAYNIAPTHEVPIVRRHADTDELELVQARWGLIPRAFDGPASTWSHNTINAKSETASELRSFRDAFPSRWCVIPMSGYYEWKGKQPYAIKLRNRRFFFALGLWDKHVFEGTTTTSFTIFMTDGNALDIHKRMPVIPDQSEVRAALFDPMGVGRSFFKPYPANDMTAWNVGPEIGDVNRQGGAELIEEYNEDSSGYQFSMFD